MSPVLGFVGLGHMSGPTSRRLLKAEHRLVMHDRSADATAETAASAAEAAMSPAVAQEDIVFTSLPPPAIVERVVLGPDGTVGPSKVRDRQRAKPAPRTASPPHDAVRVTE